MAQSLLAVITLIALAVLFSFYKPPIENRMLTLQSPAFEHNSLIPGRFTCDGENIAPPLKISGVPAAARSLVLIMDDPDVPKNLRPDGMWDHWVKFNMPAKDMESGEGEEPSGTAGKGSGGNLGYNGPCPPDREHRYFFKLYALSGELSLAEGASKAEVEAAMAPHVIEQAELVGRYDRPQNKTR